MKSPVFYRAAVAVGTSGLVWIGLSAAGRVPFTPCIVKHVTGIPCPSCGTTRAMLAALDGDVWHAFQINPLGPVLLLALLVAVPLLVLDLLNRESRLESLYQRTLALVRVPRVAVPLVALVCVNWAWNISKGL
jgi:hypothetical protein